MKNTLFLLLVFVSAFGFTQNNTFKNMTETDNGFIGIGTAEPDEMLTVKGTIHTQEVLVDLDGAVAPDYVFETYFSGFSALKPDYRLLPIYELESYLKENNHLPNMPSAREFDEKGISLKEMNLRLLEKVEELTLYTIEQQKQIDTLTQKVEKLMEDR